MSSQLFSYHDDTHYRTTSGTGNAASIFRLGDCNAKEHEHPEAQISLLFGGLSPSLLVHTESGKSMRTRIAPQCSLFFPSGQPHRVNWNGNGALLNLYLSPVSLQELADESGWCLPKPHFVYRSDGRVHEIGQFLLDDFMSLGGLAPTAIDHAIALVAHRVFRTAAPIALRKPSTFLTLQRLAPAIDKISAAPQDDFTLVELARLCNSSVFHFARSFSARVGHAPFRFQRTLRLQKAAELLAGTDLSVELIAGKVGIENATHFSRLFRRQFGSPPREYRNRQHGLFLTSMKAACSGKS
jgi:AraC-like DNA-binding protein